jgi:hypothetical protein
MAHNMGNRTGRPQLFKPIAFIGLPIRIFYGRLPSSKVGEATALWLSVQKLAVSEVKVGGVGDTKPLGCWHELGSSCSSQPQRLLRLCPRIAETFPWWVLVPNTEFQAPSAKQGYKETNHEIKFFYYSDTFFLSL